MGYQLFPTLFYTIPFRTQSISYVKADLLCKKAGFRGGQRWRATHLIFPSSLKFQGIRGLTLLTRNGSLSSGNKRGIGTNWKLCSVQSTVTGTAFYKRKALNITGNNISSESSVMQPGCGFSFNNQKSTASVFSETV